MTKEDKELLLKDLCARLPYGVKVQYENNICGVQYIEPSYNELCLEYPNNSYTVPIGDIRPFLRPMSSMTEEERAEMSKAIQKDKIKPYGEIKSSGCDNLLLCTTMQAHNLIDWMLKNHFDFHNLIERGLAIEATGREQALTGLHERNLKIKVMTQYINKAAVKLKNITRKKFRIVKNDLSEEGAKAFNPLWYRIEQRYTILFFIHWWGTPTFEPPHLFTYTNDATKNIKEHYQNAIIYDCYSENKCQK